MTQPPARQIRVPEGVLIRQLGDESVLLNLESESYFGLDEVGTRMWSALEHTASLQDAFQVLIEEYDVEPEQLRNDLDTFVERLAEAGLVQVVDG